MPRLNWRKVDGLVKPANPALNVTGSVEPAAFRWVWAESRSARIRV